MSSIDTTLAYSNYVAPALTAAAQTDASTPREQTQSAPQQQTQPQPGSSASVDNATTPSASGGNAAPTEHRSAAYSMTGASAGHSSSADSKSSDDTLKNTGVKTEVQIEKGVGVVVQLVQSGTNKVVMQSPPQGVIDMVAQIQQNQDKEMKIAAGSDNSESAAATAEDAVIPSGSLIDELA